MLRDGGGKGEEVLREGRNGRRINRIWYLCNSWFSIFVKWCRKKKEREEPDELCVRELKKPEQIMHAR
jgi:hypothetical protein